MFVSRAGLMMLIAWGVGVSLLLDTLLAGRRPWAALCVGVAVLVEQGITTESYDKVDNRTSVSSLAARVGGDTGAFFYSPHDAPRRWPKAHLDAMWAGLEADKPTLNGYSGMTPVGWRDLEDCTVNGPADIVRLRDALSVWRREHGGTVGVVRWLGGPEGWEAP
jgi:hypothetical protein